MKEINEIKEKLIEKLRNSGWQDIMKGYTNSEDFTKVVEKLYNMVNIDNIRFTPSLKQVFRAFEECNYKDVKVVIVGMDPYPALGVSDGIAFSCSNIDYPAQSLKQILSEIDRTIYNTDYKKKTKEDIKPLLDLKRLANQGVFLINTALTTEVGKTGKHFQLWEGFIKYLFDMLTKNNPDLIWVFWGAEAKKYSQLIDDKQVKIFASHPASAIYTANKQWDCKDNFNEINNQLDKKKKEKIIW